MSSNPFYNSRAWVRVRRAALIRDHYLCVRHLERRQFVAANTVHHIRHLDEHPELALDLDNLESLCGDCHNIAHPEKRGAPAPEQPTGVVIYKL